jgi:hypothetical protein
MDVTEPEPVLRAPKHRWLRYAFWVFAVVAITAPLWCVEAAWGGRFQLDVQLQSQASQPIHSVSYATFFRREEADSVVSNSDDPAAISEFKAAQDFDGKRFVVDVRCGGRKWLGFDRIYSEERFIVLRVDYLDGEQLHTIEEIPAGRHARSMTVTIP